MIDRGIGMALVVGSVLAAGPAWAETVAGRVTEAGNGDPVAGAEILLPDGRVITTDRRGRFEVELDPGLYAFEVESWNHQPALVPVVVPLTSRLVIALYPLEDSSEIVVESFRPTSHISRHTIDAEEAYETPGTQEDAVRLVQSLPSAQVQREFAPSSGDISVRGSTPGDNRYYLDGVELPYLYHFNQYASVFPTTQLDTLELYPSSFGTPYGDSVGAIIEATSKTERPEVVHGSVNVNTIMAGADVLVPVGQQWFVGVSARRSYQDLLPQELSNDASTQFRQWPAFYDFTLRAEHVAGDPEAGSFQQTGLFVIGAGDQYERVAGELDLLDDAEARKAAYLDFQRDFQVFGGRHRWNATHSEGRVVAAVVHDRLLAELDYGDPDRDDEDGLLDQQTTSLLSRADAHGTLSDRYVWGAGYEVRGDWTGLEVDNPGTQWLSVQNELPILTRADPQSPGADLDTDAELLRLRAAVYGELHILLGRAKNLRVIPGLRSQIDTASTFFTLSPRVAARWRVADQTELKLAVGRYNQSAASNVLMGPIGDRTLGVTGSWQVGFGIDQTFADRLEVALDGYWKGLDNPIVDEVGRLPRAVDEGRAFGAELTVRYRILERFFLTGWFGAMHTELRDGARWYPGAQDQRITLGLVASWNPTSAINLAFRYRFGSGLPFTAVSNSIYDANADAWLPVLGAVNGARMPGYHKFDLAGGYTFTFPRWQLALRLELWYVPESSNQLYPIWSYDYREQGWVAGIPILPLVGARVTF